MSDPAYIFNNGPNVVTLNVDEAYFFVMNMFIHDPCIHDFNLDGLGADRTTWANNLFEKRNAAGNRRVRSNTGGGGQAGGRRRQEGEVLKAGELEKVKNAMSEWEGENIEDKKVESIECILNAFEDGPIGEADLNVIIQELAKEFPGITKYDIIKVDHKNKIDQGVKEGFYEMDELFSEAGKQVEENARADEERMERLDMNMTTNNIKVMIRDAIENGGNFDCEYITTGIKSLNGEIGGLQDWFSKYIESQQGGGAGINYNVSRINNVIQKGGTPESPGIDSSPHSPAKGFLTDHNPLLYYDEGKIKDWRWFTDPLPPVQTINNNNAVDEYDIFTPQLKFKNIFADNLIKALQYFDPNIKYENIINTTIDNDTKTQTTEFKINDSSFDRVLINMLVCLDRMAVLWTEFDAPPAPPFLVLNSAPPLPPPPPHRLFSPVGDDKGALRHAEMNRYSALLKDLPSGLFTPLEDNSENFLLFSSPQLTDAFAAAEVGPTRTLDKFSTDLPKIFSDKWEDQNDYTQSGIDDVNENDYIRIAWFLYELSNCLIIYNYLYMLVKFRNRSPTSTVTVTKGVGARRILGWMQPSARTGVGDKESYVLKVNLKLTSDGTNQADPLSRLSVVKDKFESSNVVAGGKYYIQALYAKQRQPRGKTPVLEPRSKNLINLSLDCVIYSVLAALKDVPVGTSDHVDFYQKVLNAHFTTVASYPSLSKALGKKGRNDQNDGVIMLAYLTMLNLQQRNVQGQIMTPSPLVTNYDNALVNCSAVPHIPLTAPTEKAFPHFNRGPARPNELVKLLNGGDDIENKDIIYINNAAQNIYDSPNNVGTTNIASVIDPQPTFPKFLKSSDEELGNMDITIKSPDNEIFYRVRVRIINVDPDSGELRVQIDAYLKIAGIVLVYLDENHNAPGDPFVFVPTDDGNGVDAHQALDLDQFTREGNKLKASQIFKEIVTKVTDLFCTNEQRVDQNGAADNTLTGKINSEMVYKYLSGIDLPMWDGSPKMGNGTPMSSKYCRRLIIETSFKKGLGDFLQEVLGWAPNRGYAEGTLLVGPSPGRAQQAYGKRKNNIGYDIRHPPQPQVVIQLNNDTPSGLRGIFFNNMRQKDRFWTTPATPYKSICGYLYTHKETWAKDNSVNNTTLYKRHWKVKYAVQGFNPDVTYPQGGGGKKKGGQKTKKKRRVKYSTIRRKSKKTRTSRRKRRKRRRHTTRN